MAGSDQKKQALEALLQAHISERKTAVESAAVESPTPWKAVVAPGEPLPAARDTRGASSAEPVAHKTGVPVARSGGLLSRLRARHVVAGGLCFLAGAVFWNFVGVWRFIHEVVERPAQASIVQPLPSVITSREPEMVVPPRTVTAPVRPASVQVESGERAARAEAKHCSKLILERSSGTVRVARCEPVIRVHNASSR